MKVYTINSRKYTYNKKIELKKRTVMVFENLVRALVIDNKWCYCLQDILAVTVPAKNSGQHVAEWVRRSAWLPCSVFKLDSQTHYASWDDCCELAKAFMYVYRQHLSAHGRVRYSDNGEFSPNSTPCHPAVCADAPPYRLWRALLDFSPDTNKTSKSMYKQLFSTLDFGEPEILSKALKPRVYSEQKRTRTIPVVDKATVKDITASESRATEGVAVATKKPIPEPSVKLGLPDIKGLLPDMNKGAVSTIIAALISGKKFKIEISIGD